MKEEYRFKHEALIKAAEELVRFDEVELAQKVLKCVPAVYRDNPIKEVEDLKATIQGSLITAHGYMTAELDQNVSVEFAKVVMDNTLRGKTILKEVQALNAAGIEPHIVEIGPGEYWLPIGLNQRGCRFSYKPIAMDGLAAVRAKALIEHIPSEYEAFATTIFVANEIIEHLAHTDDLVVEALIHCRGWPDYVQLSTPLYTFDCRPKEWWKPYGLPHLRAYTPMEFALEAERLFPGYVWDHDADNIQSLRGKRK